MIQILPGGSCDGVVVVVIIVVEDDVTLPIYVQLVHEHM